jgi:EF-hand domain pair
VAAAWTALAPAPALARGGNYERHRPEDTVKAHGFAAGLTSPLTAVLLPSRVSQTFNNSRRHFMRKAQKYLVIGVVTSMVFSYGAWRSHVRAASETPPPRDKIALGEDDVKALLGLMDQDKNGKVSQKEFMKFMKAEFERLDKDHSGELDVKELTAAQIKSSTSFLSGGK